VKERMSPPEKCQVDDCSRFEVSKGFCLAHYKRYKKFGDPTVGGLLKPKREKSSNRFVEVDGVSLTIYEAEAKYEVKADLIWLRLTKLGWTPRQSVGLDAFKSNSLKSILFRGKTYKKQEDLYKDFAETSNRSVTTMRIAMAALRKSGLELTDELIEEALFGRWQPEDKGGYLYKVTCVPNGKIYIGITSRPIEERWVAHLGEARAGVNSPLKKAIREFGKESFTVENLGYFNTAKKLKQIEKDEILKNNSLFPLGLNSNKGGTLGGIDRIPVFYLGKKYRSMSDLAREFGLTPNLLKSRVNQDGMSLVNALELGPAKNGGRRIPPRDGQFFNRESWSLNGKVFQTLEEVGKHYEISAKTIAVRMSNGWKLEDAVIRFSKIACLECGSLFVQKKTDHKFCSTKCKQSMRGHTRRSRKPGVGNKNPSTIDGVVYLSDSEVERKLGVNRQRFRALLNNGVTPEAAVAQLKKVKKG
jgi:hypothetical protein